MKNDAKIFYGWQIVAGACLLNFAGIGIIVNSYGIFIKPVTESLGFSRGSFTLYFSIAALCMTFAAPVVGKLLEKFNIRIVMTISTTMMSVSYILFPQCQTLKQFYLLAIFLGIGSAGSHIIPVSMMIIRACKRVNWCRLFTKNQSPVAHLEKQGFG